MRALRLVPLLLPLAACENTNELLAPTPIEEFGLWTDAGGAVAHPELRRLCVAAWETDLRHDPVSATYLGDPRYDDRVEGISPTHRERQREELDALRIATGAIPTAGLSEDDLVTHAFLLEHLAQRIEAIDLDMGSWNVDPMGGPQVDFLTLAGEQPVATARQREKLVARWHDMAHQVRDRTRNLLRGLARGDVSSHTPITKVVAQIDALLKTHPMDSPLVKPALGGGRWVPLSPDGTLARIAYEEYGDALKAGDLSLLNLHLQDGAVLAEGTRVLIPAPGDPLGAEERGRFLNEVLSAVSGDVYPAFQDYRRTLVSRVLPRARTDAQPGLSHLRGGDAVYRTLIRHHTSLELSPQEIHELGLREVERIRGEMAVLGQRLFGTSDVARIQARLRGDSAMFFTSRDEVEKKAVEAMARARRKLPEYFGRLPLARCEVVRVPAHEEADTTIAYYRQPAADGSRPGRYYINTSEPATRPRYDAEVLAYHEAVPGHHLQISIAQELEGLPLVRRHSGSTAFVEGWALYTERLCDEMGLYGSDLDRLGMLSFDAWRACRLVVDTGLHSMGWSRDRAIDYMIENTLLTPNNVENEVDRYVAWPGQALAYKLGQREILALRDEAKRKLGAAFSYRQFHDRVLENGAVSLAVLRARVERWLASASSS